MRNRAKCKKCNDIIESKHRHDWVTCSCKSIYIDGGTDYMRSGGDPTCFETILDDEVNNGST